MVVYTPVFPFESGLIWVT